MSISIRKNKNHKKQRLFCEICKAVLKNALDFDSSDSFGCCEMCRLKWVEPRVKEYMSGWRPSREDINEEIGKRNSLPLGFAI